MSLSNNIGCLGWLLSGQRTSPRRGRRYAEPQYSSVVIRQTPPKAEPVAHDYRYKRKYLLTKNEWYFYKALKPIADELGYIVLSKIRMADLVEPNEPNEKMKYGAFQKIKAKHVDFALAKAENCEVVILIELDDNSHNDHDQLERDAFCDRVYRDCGYKVLRTRGTADLRQRILRMIQPEAYEQRPTNR